MQYFGIPSCPYCEKRVNIIRAWSLKRQGEYRCPRCKGISNVFLSPLVHVFAVLAVLAGIMIYFFHKFILDDIDLSIVFQIFLPFALFFLLSIFTVMLKKPVIKQIPKKKSAAARREEEMMRTGYPLAGGYPAGRNPANRREQAPPPAYAPRRDTYDPPRNASGAPAPGQDAQNRPTAEIPTVSPERAPRTEGGTRAPRAQRAQPRPTGMQLHPEGVQLHPDGMQSHPTGTQLRPEEAPVSPNTRELPVQTSAPAPRREARSSEASAPAAPVTSNDDFFKKYDDPEYVERRLREMREKQEEQ